MNTIKDGGAAFPQPDLMEDGVCLSQGETGMTLRDYFAAKAMEALITKYTLLDTLSINIQIAAAKTAYQMADAMLAERERGE